MVPGRRRWGEGELALVILGRTHGGGGDARGEDDGVGETDKGNLEDCTLRCDGGDLGQKKQWEEEEDPEADWLMELQHLSTLRRDFVILQVDTEGWLRFSERNRGHRCVERKA